MIGRRAFLAALAAAPVFAQDDPARPGNARQPQLTVATPAKIVPVLTRGYDNLRSCANIQETILTPALIRQNPLRLLFTISLPGDARGMESQPLFVPGVTIADGSVHDLCISTTMGNQVYAHDANDGTPLWMIRLGRPLKNSHALDWYNINDNWGVLSTGVIHLSTLYCVAAVASDATTATEVFVLFAVDIARGAVIRQLQLTQPNTVMQRKQRSSLTFTSVNGRNTVFVPWSTMQEFQSGSHGYITAVDADSFKVTAELNTTPGGSEGGIWQSGQGLLADTAGDLYLLTANGDYDGVNSFGECFLRVHYDGASLKVVDHWSPFLDKSRPPAFTDQDLGSGAPLIVPELNLIAGAGKDGVLFTRTLNRFATEISPAQFYDFYPGNGIDPANVANLNQNWFGRTHNLHGSSPVWKAADGYRVYCWGENSPLRAWKADATGLHYLATGNEYASAQAPVTASQPGGMPGGMMTACSNGQQNGLIFATVPDGDANSTITTGRLMAYDAFNFTNGQIPLLWKSDPLTFNKFLSPTVNAGRIYTPTYDAKILVFGS